jgi:carbon storage regulator
MQAPGCRDGKNAPKLLTLKGIRADISSCTKMSQMIWSFLPKQWLCCLPIFPILTNEGAILALAFHVLHSLRPAKALPEEQTGSERFTTQGGSDMLVLSRKIGERIIINDTITVEVLQVVGNRVRLGISAPDGIPIMREELLTAAPNSERKKETVLETAGAS